MTANPRRRDPADVCWALPEVQRAELYRVLTSMGMPTIDRTLILPDNMAHLVSRDVTVLARRLLNALAALQEPQLVVQLSGATTTDPLCAWDIVEPSGRQLVQSILVAAQQSNSPLTSAELESAKALPIFQNLEGAFVSVRECDSPCVRCSSSSPAGQVPLPFSARSKILLDTPDSQQILAALNIPVLGLPRAVSQFLIPAMAQMSLDETVAAVRYVKNHWQELRSDGDTVTLLRGTVCIPVEASDAEGGMVLRAPDEL